MEKGELILDIEHNTWKKYPKIFDDLHMFDIFDFPSECIDSFKIYRYDFDSFTDIQDCCNKVIIAHEIPRIPLSVPPSYLNKNKDLESVLCWFGLNLNYTISIETFNDWHKISANKADFFVNNNNKHIYSFLFPTQIQGFNNILYINCGEHLDLVCHDSENYYYIYGFSF